jgi:hypothetical protein
MSETRLDGWARQWGPTGEYPLLQPAICSNQVIDDDHRGLKCDRSVCQKPAADCGELVWVVVFIPKYVIVEAEKP